MVAAVDVPESAEAAREALRAGGTVLAGGTHVLAELSDRPSSGVRLVSLRKAGLSGIGVDDGTVTLGATTTLADIEHDARLGFLSGCVRTIASPPVRGLATVAGNIFVPQPYGDLAVALLALDARADILGPGGARGERLESLIEGGLRPGEFVARIRFAVPGPDAFRFHKASRRRLNSASIAAVAARISVRDGVVGDVRLALGGLAPRAVRSARAERALTGAPLNRETVAAAAAAAMDDIAPFDDAYASAWYRARVFPVHLRRALLGG